MGDENRLCPEDQAKVDEFLHTGYNSVERKPFRPLYLLVLSLVTLTVFSLLSVLIAQLADIY